MSFPTAPSKAGTAEMRYELLFDLGQQPRSDWPWLLIGLAVMAGAALGLWRQRVRGQRSAGPGFFLVFGAFCLAAGLVPIWDRHRLLQALQSGQVRVAEGRVSSHGVELLTRYDSASKRWRRSHWEAFRVGDTAFGFTQDASSVGFRNAEEPRIALRDGEWLRLHYVEDVEGEFAQRRILRLERTRPPG